MEIDGIAAGSLERETVRRLSRRSDAQGVLQLGVHLGLLIATGALLWASRGAWLAPVLLAHGAVLCFLFCALHESVHRTAFARRWANDLVAATCGALLLLPAEYFRCFHYAHHRFTQDPARDPELAAPGPATFRSYLWHVSGIPYWRERLSTSLRHALTARVREPFVPPEKSALIVREARVLWGVYLCVALVSWALSSTAALLYWVLPALLGQPLLRLFLLAEHRGCALSADMLENTRTTSSNAAVRLLAWRMPYHVEHHCFPTVPFHALARVNALMGARARVTASGYLALHRELLRQVRS